VKYRYYSRSLTRRPAGEIDHAPAKDFRRTVQARASRDAAFRRALFQEAVQGLLEGDIDAGRAAMRDYINATIGFENERRTREAAEEPDVDVRTQRQSHHRKPVRRDRRIAGGDRRAS
jgi:hypothetical protein